MQESIKHYNTEDIFDYLKGRMSPLEMHALEKAALEDPFLTDAIDGLRQGLEKHSRENLEADMAFLRNKLSREEKGLVVKAMKLGRLRFSWLSAASVIIVIAGAGTAVYLSTRTIAVRQNSISQAKNDTRAVDSVHAHAKTSTGTASTAASSIQAGEDLAIESKRQKRIPISNKEKESIQKQFVPVPDSTEPNEWVVDRKKDRSDVRMEEKNATTSSDKSAGAALSRPSAAAPASRASTFNFSGKVVDENARPVSSAAIQSSDNKVLTTTDMEGRFSLKLPSADTMLKIDIRSSGFQPASVMLGNAGYQEIILRHDGQNNLQEVVVSSPSNSKHQKFLELLDEDSQPARPLIGWDKYRKWIKKHISVPDDSMRIKGSVWISFELDHDKKLSNFQVEKSIAPDYDEEAIRLIREGPTWIWIRRPAGPIYVRVDF